MRRLSHGSNVGPCHLYLCEVCHSFSFSLWWWRHRSSFKIFFYSWCPLWKLRSSLKADGAWSVCSSCAFKQRSVNLHGRTLSNQTLYRRVNFTWICSLVRYFLLFNWTTCFLNYYLARNSSSWQRWSSNIDPGDFWLHFFRDPSSFGDGALNILGRLYNRKNAMIPEESRLLSVMVER